MKITMSDGKMIATAETIEEVQKLLSLVETKNNDVKVKRTPYKRACAQCGKKYHGLRGLALHRLQTHEGRTWSRGRKKLSEVL